MLLAHELIRSVADADGMPVPDVVVDLSDVEEAVRSNRAKLPHAPGARLPKPEGAFMPWASAVYEHPLEGPAVKRRNIYASQECSEDGLYHLTMTVIDMGLVGDELDVAYYGACRVVLDDQGVLVGFERDRSGDANEVSVEDGVLLEMVFPVLVANHLLNAGVMNSEDFDVVASEDLVFSSSLGRALQA